MYKLYYLIYRRSVVKLQRYQVFVYILILICAASGLHPPSSPPMAMSTQTGSPARKHGGPRGTQTSESLQLSYTHRMFPDLLPVVYRRQLEYPETVPVLQGRDLEQAALALIQVFYIYTNILNNIPDALAYCNLCYQSDSPSSKEVFSLLHTMYFCQTYAYLLNRSITTCSSCFYSLTMQQKYRDWRIQLMSIVCRILVLL